MAEEIKGGSWEDIGTEAQKGVLRALSGVCEDAKESPVFRDALTTDWGSAAKRLRALATSLGYNQQEIGKELHWYDSHFRRIALLLRIPDPRKLAVIKDSFLRAKTVGAPLTCLFVHQWTDGEHNWDIFYSIPQMRIGHCNRFWGSMKVRDRKPTLRQDLYTLFSCDGEWPPPGRAGWNRLFGGPAEAVEARLAEMAGEHDCTQRRDGAMLLWQDADGHVQTLFAILADHTHTDAIVKVYQQIERHKAPVTFMVLKETDDLHNLYRLSARSYLEHHNQTKSQRLMAREANEDGGE